MSAIQSIQTAIKPAFGTGKTTFEQVRDEIYQGMVKRYKEYFGLSISAEQSSVTDFLGRAEAHFQNKPPQRKQDRAMAAIISRMRGIVNQYPVFGQLSLAQLLGAMATLTTPEE